MSNYFSQKSVPDPVRAEIAARGDSRGLRWTAERFPWVHVMSMSSQNVTLEGYGTGTLYENNYVRPKPVVTGIQVKKQGELGTTKKVTVNLTAFTDQQLEELRYAYFVPGMTVRVQFGWSTCANGSSVPAPYTTPSSDPVAICQMRGLASSSPCYEGYQGMISNFSITLNENNWWDCSFEIISAAEPFVGTRIDSACCPCPRKVQGEDGKKTVKNMPQLQAALYDISTDIKQIDRLKGKISAMGVQPVFGKYAFEAEIRNPDGTAPSIMGAFADVGTGNATGFLEGAKNLAKSAWNARGQVLATGANLVGEFAKESFISFSTLEGMINYFSLMKDDAGNPYGAKLDSRDILIRTHKDLEALDPRICVIGGTKFCNKIITEVVEGGSIPTAKTGEGVKLGDIMLNTIMLYTVLNSNSESIEKFLNAVLAQVNHACGGLWELTIVNTTEKCEPAGTMPTIAVVDITATKVPGEYVIPISPSNSAVRDLKMDLKLPDAMKTMALYSNKSQDASNCTEPCPGTELEPFGLMPGLKNAQVTDAARPKATQKPDPDCVCTKAGTEDTKEEVKSFDELVEELSNKVDDTTVSAAITSLKGTKYGGPNEKANYNDSCKLKVVPFELSFTLDGIGGFSFGQTVNCSRIPSNIRNQYFHQIMTVEHSVSAQDWTTTVSTKARYKTK